MRRIPPRTCERRLHQSIESRAYHQASAEPALQELLRLGPRLLLRRHPVVVVPSGVWRVSRQLGMGWDWSACGVIQNGSHGPTAIHRRQKHAITHAVQPCECDADAAGPRRLSAAAAAP